MNIHIPQSLQTQIELEMIADVQLQIISPGSSTPIIGMVQDGLLGGYNLTAPGIRIHWKDMMNLVANTTITDTLDSKELNNIKKNKEYTGQEIFSMIIPNKISTTGKLEVKNGKIIKGQLTKKQMKAGAANSLIHLVWDQYGSEKTKEFIDNSQRLINNFNLMNGFTVGIGDIAIQEKVEKELHILFETKKSKIDHLITEIENNPDLYDKEIFETHLYNEANTIRETTSQLIMKNLKEDNNFNIMILSGSKGQDINMGQMSGCVGQQVLEGARIKKKVNGRTLAYYFQNDDSALARGFVEQPYIYGMTPEGFIFHNIGSREGIIDTAIKTAASGYIQRKLIKALEDAKITYDMTVRNANNTILQFVYGDSGIDTTKQSLHTFRLLMMGNKEVADNYKFTTTELKSYSKFSEKENNSNYKEILQMRDTIRNSIRKMTMNYIFMRNTFMLPVNMHRIINNTKSDNSLKSSSNLEPDYILKKINDVLDYSNTKLLALSKEDSKNKDSLKYRDELSSKTLLKFALHEFLSPKKCLLDLGLNKAQFDAIYDQIVEGYNKSVIEPGEMVGVVAAQSTGEPVTQLSCLKDTNIIVYNTKNSFSGKIGDFIDNLLKENKKKVVNLGNDSVVLDLKDDYKIIGVSDDEKTSWNRISQISRHPANGDLVKVTTRSGKTTTATLSHSFLKRTVDSIKAIKGSDLKVGDRIPVAKYIPVIDKSIKEVNIGEKMIKLDSEFGWFCGAYLAEGWITKCDGKYTNNISISNINKEFRSRVKDISKRFDRKGSISYNERKTGARSYFDHKYLSRFILKHFKSGSANKNISELIFTSNLEFIRGLLKGYFDGDGNVNSAKGKYSIKCVSKSEQLIKDLCLLLSYCSIFGTIGIVKKNVELDERMYSLTISGKYAQTFKDEIGTNLKYKTKALNEIIKWNNNTDKHSVKELTDKIPELGSTIANIGKLLKIPNYNRIYTRWENKESISRRTLEKYIKTFKDENKDTDDEKIKNKVKDGIKILEQAANSNIVWDQIMKLEIIKDPKEYVYDFTVPGNDSFMVDCGILVHNTLNTFHFAGISSAGTATLGVPRIREILSLSKNMKTPQMIIYLNKDVRTNKEVADKIASNIKYSNIATVRQKVDIYYDPNPLAEDGFMKQDNVHNVFHKHKPTKNSCQQTIDGLPWLMRIVLDKEKMMDKEITLLDIKSKFCNFWERRYLDTKGFKKEDKKILEKITQCAILSNSNNDNTPVIHIRFDMKDFNFSTVVGFLDLYVENLKLKGVADVDKIEGIDDSKTIDYDNEDQSIQDEQEYIIVTAGINLGKLRYINGIDLNKTRCNDIVKTYHMFGIEAARAMLYKEINGVFSTGADSVNFQHLSVLIDLMTNNGGLTSIDRHGLGKLDTDAFARASFERPVLQLLEAAVFGETDSMRSVSSRIMAGLVIKGGTGMCDTVLDTESLEKSEYLEDIEQKYHKTFNELEADTVMNDIVSKETSSMFIPI